MPVISVQYPSGEGAQFDADYYLTKHMPLVRKRWGSMGMTQDVVLRGVPGPDGAAPAYMMSVLLTFRSMEDFKAAADAHGSELFGDIPNFTNATPQMQFNEQA